MRIIGGRLKGLRITPPSNLPVRPTTDLAKEALFNILNNQLEFENLKVLDLFSGTGNMSFEFASRGAAEVVSVDRDFKCCAYVKATAKVYDLNIKSVKADVFKYLKRETEQYNLIFADAPYDIPELKLIPQIIKEQALLTEAGTLIVEHPSTITLDYYPNFTEQRKYGYSSFSFFEK